MGLNLRMKAASCLSASSPDVDALIGPSPSLPSVLLLRLLGAQVDKKIRSASQLDLSGASHDVATI
jgi:hypothetical protein